MKLKRRGFASLAILAAVTMGAVAPAMTVAAATDDTGFSGDPVIVETAAVEERSIKITAPGFDNHTFGAYQLFTGNSSDGKLTDIEWGRSVDQTKLSDLMTALQAATFETTAAEAAITALTDNSTAENYAKAFENINSDSNDAQLLGHILWDWSGWKTDTVLKSTEKTSPYTITGTDAPESLANGYYFVKDMTSVAAETSDAVSSAILRVVTQGETQVNFKGSVPTADKQTSAHGKNTYAEHNDADTAFDTKVGDIVDFRVVGTLPTNYADFSTYYYEFVDTPQNMNIDETSVKLYVDQDGDLATTTDLIEVDDDGKYVVNKGTELKISVDDTNDLNDTAGDNITVSSVSKIIATYEAQINKDALVLGDTFSNTLKINFSNDAHTDSKGQTTPEDETFKTYTATFVKYDGTDNKMVANAEFSLVNAEGTAFNLIKDDYGYHIQSDLDNAQEAVTSFKTTTDQIVISGLDNTTGYYLKEINPPSGYNKITTNTLVAKNSVKKDATISADKVYTLTTGVTGIANYKGAVLPATGGTGTILFITLGGIGAAVTGIILVTNKRMKKEDI